MADEYPTCVNCGARIQRVNFALGPEWRHWPTPHGNYRTNELYRYCRLAALVATPGSTEPYPGGEMTHSDETLVSLLRSGWRGATATDLMREAADRIEQLHSGVDEFDAVSEPDLPGFEGTRASLDALTTRAEN